MKVEKIKKTKTVKKAPAKAERYIKIVFTQEGLQVYGNYVSDMNHVEALLGLIISLVSNCPDVSVCKTALDAINRQRLANQTVSDLVGALKPCKSCKAKKATKKATKKK